MTSWDREVDLSFRGWMVAAALAAAAVLAWVVLLGSRARKEPTRCAAGFVEIGPRCCAAGQGLSAGRCTGLPVDCGPRGRVVEVPAPGCVVPNSRILVSGGSVTLGPTDWDSVDVLEKRTIAVRPFYIDQFEVTAYRYFECQRAGLCPALPEGAEPGAPVTGLSVDQAEAYCAFTGGRLPTAAEWTFSATGSDARRYPWGPHGLVCRRAAFGLVDGPCDREGVRPEMAGMRPDGATPLGIEDLSGNAAELAHDADGRVTVHGGSFRSQAAGDLKSWSTQPADVDDTVGFRCVYPLR